MKYIMIPLSTIYLPACFTPALKIGLSNRYYVEELKYIRDDDIVSRDDVEGNGASIQLTLGKIYM
jgi:hypothetical protein